MEKKNGVRHRKMTTRISEQEYQILLDRFHKTTCRRLTEYVRKVLFSRPLIGTTRDRSPDDLMTELVGLKAELNRVGNNYNQVVAKLHSLKDFSMIKGWMVAFEFRDQQVRNELVKIRQLIEKMVSKWLQ